MFQDTMITWGLGEAESAGVENSHGEGKRGNNMEERGGFLTEPKEPPAYEQKLKTLFIIIHEDYEYL